MSKVNVIIPTYIEKVKKQISLYLKKKDPYDLWISKNEPDNAQLAAMRRESKSWTYRPKVSIVTPVYNPGKYDLTQCIQSVIDQVYDNWELCIVDGKRKSGQIYFIFTIKQSGCTI